MVEIKKENSPRLKPEPFDNRIKLPPSRRLRVAIYSTVVLMIIGLIAFWYAPEELDHLSDYVIAAILPLITFILGESCRPSQNSYRGNSNKYDRYLGEQDFDPDQNP